VIVGCHSSRSKSRIMTLAPNADSPTQIELDLENFEIGLPKWSNYIKGVIAQFSGKRCFGN
jgi:hypothetical protein